MKCLILVGGYGTRLRPLTLTSPKSLVPFCNLPIVEHQIAAAVECGVDHVVLAVGFQPEHMQHALKEMETKYGVKITCSIETEPLGTAGPLYLARDILLSDDEPIFVFNSDVICDFPLKDLLKFHKSHGKEGTIVVTKVEDPSRFGVVVYDELTGKIDRFVEKPKEFVGDRINAGLYILSNSVIEQRIGPRFMMIETDVFPQMATDAQLYCFQLEGYWADIGQPKDYLRGMSMHLNFLSHKNEDNKVTKTHEKLARSLPGVEIVGNVLIDESAKIGEGSKLGPDVTIGPGVVIGRGCRVKGSAVMDDAVISDYATVFGSIIGWKSRIGSWTRVDPMTVAAESVDIKSELYINGAFLLPFKGIKDSVPTNGQIIM
ncbi:Mannose-1-phosphate guanyltransferase, putative [Perkinsus marinus ATCC 50983]|uniref:mannose-1-phosphate guanylyltransferase n=1 Tax=Perkinsus marinus (strain ATCC 50983 / TXsc) TaxID=423536 RepID=C5KTB9_PERM5|nr:Mannose-1-phosphate guanyltransferase, putative [Perkinsus marinus ATCC 50983]EER12224.1 Mannose-1-phosphate guanyltransferase, putative [Perkinsus marinus ATCC 50983]|eukprot:XP_002780429.1 Mannose-1-phosphate guanyltransferase, putative [Perkinsus marinus ATCC 50983]